ncbi:hypothetical protein [Actinophytocola sp.]
MTTTITHHPAAVRNMVGTLATVLIGPGHVEWTAVELGYLPRLSVLVI